MNQPNLAWPIDTEGIQKILDFANADLSDPEAVSRLGSWGVQYESNDLEGFGQIGFRFEKFTGWELTKGITIYPTTFPKRPGSGDSTHQFVLRSLLDKIVEYGRCTQEVEALIDSTLIGLDQPGFSASSRGLRFYLHVKTLPEWYCLGLVALIHTELDQWLSLCTLDDCKNYFIDWPGKRGHAGKAQRYCCKNHGDIDKQRRYRKRKKREKSARGISI